MKLTFPLLNTTINVPVDDSMTAGKVSRRTALRKKSEKTSGPLEKLDNSSTENIVPNKPLTEEKQTEPSTESTTSESQPILMVEVVNVTHEKFRQTEEIKVIITIFIKYL